MVQVSNGSNFLSSFISRFINLKLLSQTLSTFFPRIVRKKSENCSNLIFINQNFLIYLFTGFYLLKFQHFPSNFHAEQIISVLTTLDYGFFLVSQFTCVADIHGIPDCCSDAIDELAGSQMHSDDRTRVHVHRWSSDRECCHRRCSSCRRTCHCCTECSRCLGCLCHDRTRMRILLLFAWVRLACLLFAWCFVELRKKKSNYYHRKLRNFYQLKLTLFLNSFQNSTVLDDVSNQNEKGSDSSEKFSITSFSQNDQFVWTISSYSLTHEDDQKRTETESEKLRAMTTWNFASF